MRPLLVCVLCCLAAAPASAAAASRLVIRGAGYGHGVGMSQYGAYGFALHGAGYGEILAHYYTGTGLGTVDPGRPVRVLLQSPRGRAVFSGADRAGERRLDPVRSYSVRRRDGELVDLVSAGGRRLATFGAPLRVTGPGPLTLHGLAANGRVDGAYRGALEFLPGTFGGVNVVNAVGLDEYLQGVVPVELPPTWPPDALAAQAVAARTFAITTSKGGAGFDQYADTRSQMYGGIGVEAPATNDAVARTRGQVVTYQGQPVVTFFFSTSGGQTENIENVFGGTARPWLRSVDDPYDDVSPRHRWGPVRMSLKSAGRKLRGLVKGRFRGVEVLARGASPRVLAAEVIGSRGRTRVSGAALRARFDLLDTWAFFTSISSTPTPPPPDEPPSSDPLTGGATPSLLLGSALPPPVAHGGLQGRIAPARRGASLTVERRVRGRWAAAGSARVGRGGRYRARVAAAGTYRVRLGDVAGPAVRVR